MRIVPVILSGGSGTRLWPVSRESQPKPFMTFDGKSLLQRTVERANALASVEHIAVVTNMAYSYKTAEEMMKADALTPASLLLEPFGRNTAPAIALAALWAQAKFGDDVVLLVLAADHLIEHQELFADAVAKASKIAVQEGRLVLFGMTPATPETGFGYIELGTKLSGHDTACEVARFVEKPSAERAQEFVDSGRFVWNSGMFCFTAGAIHSALEQHAPDVLAAAKHVFEGCATDAAQIQFDATKFSACPDISIDYAVMERAKNVAVLPCEFGWSDIGSWKAVSDMADADDAGNAVEGKAMLVNSKGTYVKAGDRLVAAVGVEDLVVIDTPDAVLVSHKSSTQQVKEIVSRLKQGGFAEAKEHLTVERPWGKYSVVHETAGYKIKRVEVKPGQKLSLQMHRKRSEHWVVTEGEARVTIGEVTYDLPRNCSAFVPIGAKHRLENVTNEPLVIVEVQCGDYLGEDDIVRFSDVYGRV
ncbi:MAG TPA: mannose-1-phosphate guanylyltransferase/mannose-6-phosphate isomerase [Burkholderiaceae bacterium]|nr:mannose-1-phosphate guanylyltransferase/mannose-6-phosphate isomerase [Burkholderiaceae bacterium]